jgi:hypothetical protein
MVSITYKLAPKKKFTLPLIGTAGRDLAKVTFCKVLTPSSMPMIRQAARIVITGVCVGIIGVIERDFDGPDHIPSPKGRGVQAHGLWRR